MIAGFSQHLTPMHMGRVGHREMRKEKESWGEERKGRGKRGRERHRRGSRQKKKMKGDESKMEPDIEITFMCSCTIVVIDQPSDIDNQFIL